MWRRLLGPGYGQPQTVSWFKLCDELDAGEAEAITLALEVGAEFLLMDERLGREIALHMGVRCVGLIGILVEARQKGLSDKARPFLDALREVAGFWLSETLYQRVLEDEGQAL